ncbi:hypothetical protein [Mesorhizobium sp. 1B3]|uniref:hypothetical protein n=1 Tax=Mesorhizobium sp. 1B3 TaxID=3243599 RepID=UPI003D95EF85
MKIFSVVLEALRTDAPVPSEEEKAAWLRDPLSHPALETMTSRELADLPFSRGLASRSFAPQHCCR